MASTSGVSQFPVLNPNTSLAFVTPPLAAQLEATRYLSVASLAAFIWDLLCSLVQDHRLLTQYTISVPTVVYFISRIASLAHIITTTVFHVAPVSSCHTLIVGIGWCWAVAVPSTSLLFFFRVRAVFDKQPFVVAFFGFLWFATLAGSITVPFALDGRHIAGTDRCLTTSVQPFSIAGLAASMCNDTLVFIAISWHVITHSTVKGRVKSFFGGHDLPYISRALIQGGQQYYLIAVGGNILVMAIILSPSTPPLIREMFPVAKMALENSMACRVFRDIKLGITHPTRYTSGADDTSSHPGVPGHALRTIGGTKIIPTHVPVMDIRKNVEQFDEIESVHAIKGGVGAFPGREGREDAYV